MISTQAGNSSSQHLDSEACSPILANECAASLVQLTFLVVPYSSLYFINHFLLILKLKKKITTIFFFSLFYT